MARFFKPLALVLVLAVACGARADENTPRAANDAEPAAEAQSATGNQPPLGSPFEWFIVGTCLLISVWAGGYTLFSYLRRRDTLSTLETMEARYRFRGRESGFDRGPD